MDNDLYPRVRISVELVSTRGQQAYNAAFDHPLPELDRLSAEYVADRLREVWEFPLDSIKVTAKHTLVSTETAAA